MGYDGYAWYDGYERYNPGTSGTTVSDQSLRTPRI